MTELAVLEFEMTEVMELRRLNSHPRLGFQREGFLCERWHVNGEIQDALFYGLLRREWLKELPLTFFK